MCGAIARFAAALALLLAAPVAGAAERSPQAARALLVGVSEYPSLPASLQLAGPRHDVKLMRELLLERGVPDARIRVLADGVAGAGLPTRQAILDELDRLGRESRPGEQVVVYFAGHGSQQPADPADAADEPDGLSEIFLPRDVGRWEPRPGRPSGSVANAIVDRELRERVDRIGATGAAVWAIFDACHSATLVRGGDEAEPLSPDFRWRRVRPEVLGVPPARAAVARAQPGRARTPPRPPPHAVYFYASQSTESTPELKLPPRSSDAVPQGLFTYALVASMSGGAAMSFRQLQQAILMRYDAMQDGVGITPQFGGDGLDEAVPGPAAQPVRQWRLHAEGGRLQLAAGQMAELRPGALLAVLPKPVSPLSAALGYVRVDSATVATATLVPVAHEGLREAPIARLQAGAVARLVRASPALGLAVAADLQACAAPCVYEAALRRLRESPPDGVQWIEPGAGAELRLVAVGSRLWFLPVGSAQRPCTAGTAAEQAACAAHLSRQAPSLLAAPGASAQAVGDAIAETLASILRATQLLRSAAAAGPLPAAPFDPEVIFSRAANAAAGPPQLRDGDTVTLRWRNRSDKPVDVTALYVDARYGIQALYPPASASPRLMPGAEAAVTLTLDTADSEGLERLLLIAVPGQRHAEGQDYGRLAQPTLPAERVVRGGAADGSTVRVVSWRLVR